MPTYAYACTACDHRFEQVQAFSDDALTSCPECEGRLRKLFNSVGVVFKGSGFYRTDSRSQSGQSASSSTPASAGSAAGGSKDSSASTSTASSSGTSSGGSSGGSSSSSSSTGSAA